MRRWQPPAGAQLGTFLVPGPTGWTRWLPANGPVRLPSTVALEAGPGALDGQGDLAEVLPRALVGISFHDLDLDDATLASVTRALPRLSWLDVRGTRVTADGLRAACRPRGARGRRIRHVAVDPGEHAQVRSALPARITVHADANPAPIAGPRPQARPDHDELLRLTREGGPPAVPVAGARQRAEILLDAGRPSEALGLIAPELGTRDPGVCVLAARCAAELTRPNAALAALDLATPSPDVTLWRAIILVSLDPVGSLDAADQVLSTEPDAYLARWARCRAFLSLGQYDAAELELDRLSELRPGDSDTLRTEARLAGARRQHRRSVTAWQALLAQTPDDPVALAGLATAQLARRPLSPAWMRSLAGAAASDMDEYGTTLLASVTRHRRAWARLLGLLSFVAALVVAGSTGALDGLPGGLVYLVPLVTASLVALGLWRGTPAEVRRTIRRTDQLTGTHRAPSWRRGAVASCLVGLAVLLSVLPAGDPDPCPSGAACTLPDARSTPSRLPFEMPTPVTPSIDIEFPSLSPIPDIPTEPPPKSPR